MDGYTLDGETVAGSISIRYPCPVCEGPTTLKHKDDFGSIKVQCEKHGVFSLQRG